MIRGIVTMSWSMAFVAVVAAGVVAQQPPDEAGLSGTKRITLNYAQGSIRDALRLVAEQGGVNLVIGSGVEGEVSVYLSEVSIETALRAIAGGNGLSYAMKDGVISVSQPPKRDETADGSDLAFLVTRVFTLRSQDAERVRDALEFALTQHGKMKVLNENSDALYGVQRLNDLSGNFDDDEVNSGGASSNANQNPAQAVSILGQGSLAPPRNARLLVVTDVEENVNRIADLIADLDKLPPQVLIEARIIEMTTDLQRQLGIDWNVNVLANGPVLNHELPLRFRAGFSSGGQIRRGSDGTANSSAGLALGTIDFSAFSALLRIHQSDNAIRLLANPKLLVFNNHSASILVGERYPLLEANITDEGTLTESFDTYIPIGIQLEVTPTIMIDGRVSLMVHPATSALGDDVVGTTGLRLARINTRELHTRVIMRDGETIVLGGLISDRKTRHVTKVPGLGDLFGLSALFRQENPRSERVDLLIFLTARIDAATQMGERDREILEMYRPHFKHLERLQNVQLHFEAPTEYEPPRPMFGDPPSEDEVGLGEEAPAFDPGPSTAATRTAFTDGASDAVSHSTSRVEALRRQAESFVPRIKE